MNDAIVGMLIVGGIAHIILIAVPIANTLQASISALSKIYWCLFLILLPFVGVSIFHFRFRSSLFQGKAWQISAADERARSGTLAPRDDD